jgi:hypothetical protein
MKLLLVVMTAGLTIKLAFSAVITHWVPRPDPDHLAWNIAKEAAMDRAGVDEVRGVGGEHAQYPSR